MSSIPPSLDPPFVLTIAMVVIMASAWPVVSRVSQSNWRRAAIKTVPVALLAAVSLRWGAPALVTAGLAFGALGDFLLAFSDKPSRSSEKAFLGGLGAFLLAHLAYLGAFAGAAQWAQLGQMPMLPATTLVLFIALLMGRILFARAGALRLPVMAYIAAIGAMVLAALATGSTLLMAGALAFMASDLILGLERFVLPQDHAARAFSGPLLWALYVLAQILILSGSLAA